MGPLGGQEMFLILIVILLLFGAKKLPELARGMGRSLGEFKKAKDEFEHEIMTADQDAYHGRPEKKAESVRREESIASASPTGVHAGGEEPVAAADHSGGDDREAKA